MQDLTAFIRRHKGDLNLSEISRKSGLSRQHLKNIANGQRELTPNAERAVRPVLEALVDNFPKG